MKINVKGSIIPSDQAWMYDWFGMEYTTPKMVNDMLEKANGARIDVYINSGGGNIFAGAEIYTAIRAYTGSKQIHIVGMAGSAASVVACAGPSEISPPAMMMVHNVSSGGAAGDYHVQDKESEILRKANEALAAAYQEKSGKKMDDILAMMDRETWLTATEAIERKLVDKIMPPAVQQPDRMVADAGYMLPPQVIEKMRSEMKSPEVLKAQAQLELLKLKGAIKS